MSDTQPDFAYLEELTAKSECLHTSEVSVIRKSLKRVQTT